MSEEIKYFDEIPAVPIVQKGQKFYVFKIDAKKLLGISYTSPRTQYMRKGIQRGLDKKRLKEIGNYIKSQNGPTGILPNIIICSLSKDSYYKDGNIYIANKKSGEAFIIDGQHRLFSFDDEWSGKTTFDLVVSAFIEIDDGMKAFIFRTINEKQRKINPSLVYDLIPMLRDDWVDYEDKRAQYLVEELNQNQESMWYDGISMLGTRDRTITQASFIGAIKSLFKKDKIFTWEEDFYEEVIQRDLLIIYFNAIAEVFTNSWKNSNYILCKNAGVASMINILDIIVKDLKTNDVKLTNDQGLMVDKSHFKPYLKKIENYNFKSKEVGKLFLGASGIRNLTNELNSLIFPEV
ncbi:MAG: DGQHR domain-containing protein [Ignavibacteriales bacterium]|nr:DGQHR domain-containing protein [Ignavibacteriales bacterium]